MCFKWSDLFEFGTLVDIDVRQERFQVRLEPSDIGIDDDGNFKKAIDPGFNKLIAKEYLEKLQSLIYEAKVKVVENNSIPFIPVYGARYIPHTVINDVVARLETVKVSFRQAVEELIQKYDEAKSKQVPEIRKALEKYLANNPNKESIIEGAMARIVTKYPTPEEIRQKFSISYRARNICAPGNAEIAKAFEDESAEVKDAVHNIVADLRKELTDKITKVTLSAAKNKYINDNTRESIDDLCKRLDAMNILQDSGLREATKRLKDVILSEDANFVGQELIKIRQDLDASAEQARKDAEARLTKLGNRKLDL